MIWPVLSAKSASYVLARAPRMLRAPAPRVVWRILPAEPTLVKLGEGLRPCGWHCRTGAPTSLACRAAPRLRRCGHVGCRFRLRGGRQGDEVRRLGHWRGRCCCRRRCSARGAALALHGARPLAHRELNFLGGLAWRNVGSLARFSAAPGRAGLWCHRFPGIGGVIPQTLLDHSDSLALAVEVDCSHPPTRSRHKCDCLALGILHSWPSARGLLRERKNSALRRRFGRGRAGQVSW